MLSFVIGFVCFSLWVFELLNTHKEKTKMFKCSLAIRDNTANSDIKHNYSIMLEATCLHNAICDATKIFLSCDKARMRYTNEVWHSVVDSQKFENLKKLIHKECCNNEFFCIVCKKIVYEAQERDFREFIDRHMVIEPFRFGEVSVAVSGSVH